MWLSIFWGVMVIATLSLFVWMFRTGTKHGIAEQENEGYEAESKAREIARRIVDGAKRDWLRHRDKG